MVCSNGSRLVEQLWRKVRLSPEDYRVGREAGRTPCEWRQSVVNDRAWKRWWLATVPTCADISPWHHNFIIPRTPVIYIAVTRASMHVEICIDSGLISRPMGLKTPLYNSSPRFTTVYLHRIRLGPYRCITNSECGRCYWWNARRASPRSAAGDCSPRLLLLPSSAPSPAWIHSAWFTSRSNCTLIFSAIGACVLDRLLHSRFDLAFEFKRTANRDFSTENS